MDIGVGGPENGNLPLLYVVKMSLHRWVVQKSLKTPLRSIKMAPDMNESKVKSDIKDISKKIAIPSTLSHSS